MKPIMSFIKKWSGHGCLLFSNSVKATYQFYGTKCDPVCKNRSYLHIQLMNHVFPSELANKVNITSLIVHMMKMMMKKTAYDGVTGGL